MWSNQSEEVDSLVVWELTDNKWQYFVFFIFTTYNFLFYCVRTTLKSKHIRSQKCQGTNIASSTLKDGKIIDAAVGGCKRK